MAAPTYGSYQPGAVDPWNIENMLQKEAITSPADAQGLASVYMNQRIAQGNVYGQEAEQQHLFAKDQLAQQMAEARLKAVYEMTGKTGGNALIAGGGLPGVGPSAGGDPAAWAAFGHAGERADFAKDYDLIGKATEGLSRAGQDVAIQQIPGYTNLQTTGQGEHSDISVEKIKAATALQTAAMHAAAKGAAGPSAGSFSTQLDVGPETNNRAYSARSYRNEPLEHFVDRTTPASKRPVKSPGDQSTAQTDPGGARGRGNAGAATRNVAPAGRVANAAPGADAVQRQYQTYVETKLRTQNPAAYADIMAQAQRNGGAVQLGRDAKGTFIQGARGTYQ